MVAGAGPRREREAGGGGDAAKTVEAPAEQVVGEGPVRRVGWLGGTGRPPPRRAAPLVVKVK